MIYLRAGLYAEGPTDYYFFTPLLERLLWEVGNRVLPGAIEVAEPLPLDAPVGTPKGREVAIPAAIAASWEECSLYIIHTDGAGDPEAMRRNCCDPAIAATRAMLPTAVLVSCVPVRETEAWMLSDPEVFLKLRRARVKLELPRDPEGLLDPKQSLRAVLSSIGMKSLEDVYSFFGNNVALDALRRLSAFRRLEDELCAAVREVGHLR